MRTYGRQGLRVGCQAMLLAIGCGALAAESPEEPAGGRTKAGPVLTTFGYRGVRLLTSRWQQQQQEVIDEYLGVPSDDYLKGFRQRAGKPAPGKVMGGWYSSDIFNPFGQIVSGLARLHAATGRDDIKAKVDALVAGFADCLADDGYFFYSWTPNAPHYEYDKMLCGMLDAWRYCGNAEARRAMDRITDWAIAHLDRERLYKKNERNANDEWYTLSENLYRAYLATGDPKYRDFGKVWEYREWWDKIATKDIKIVSPPATPWMPWHHAYSHVNALNGLGPGYLISGDPYYRDTLEDAYDFIQASQTYVTGGYGPFEHLMPRDRLDRAIRQGHRHFETQCGSWAAFKVSKWLLELTGDARYGDWAEQVVCNGVGASIPLGPDGAVQYFSNYSSRGGKKQNINPWSCCTGTRPQAVADYTDLVFLQDKGGIYVNLFLPARAHWDTPDGEAALRLETEFPTSDLVRLVVEKAPQSPFTVHFRAPGWLAGPPSVQLRGEDLATTRALNWIEVTRRWRPGDAIELRLPMGLRWEPFMRGRDWPGAITHGPVTLALLPGSGNPAEGTTPGELLAHFKQVDAGRLLWKIEGKPGVVAEPFYEVPAGRTYHVYLDPAAGPFIDLGVGWKSNEHGMNSPTPGAVATVDFEGRGIRWLWERFDDAGIARVEIDGKTVATVDQYDQGRQIPAQSEFAGLADGKHTLRIICTGEKAPKSRSHVINILDFEPIP